MMDTVHLFVAFFFLPIITSNVELRVSNLYVESDMDAFANREGEDQQW